MEQAGYTQSPANRFPCSRIGNSRRRRELDQIAILADTWDIHTCWQGHDCHELRGATDRARSGLGSDMAATP
jgi:hypothetical protein